MHAIAQANLCDIHVALRVGVTIVRLYSVSQNSLCHKSFATSLLCEDCCTACNNVDIPQNYIEDLKPAGPAGKLAQDTWCHAGTPFVMLCISCAFQSTSVHVCYIAYAY